MALAITALLIAATVALAGLGAAASVFERDRRLGTGLIVGAWLVMLLAASGGAIWAGLH